MIVLLSYIFYLYIYSLFQLFFYFQVKKNEVISTFIVHQIKLYLTFVFRLRYIELDMAVLHPAGQGCHGRAAAWQRLGQVSCRLQPLQTATEGIAYK